MFENNVDFYTTACMPGTMSFDSIDWTRWNMGKEWNVLEHVTPQMQRTSEWYKNTRSFKSKPAAIYTAIIMHCAIKDTRQSIS